MTVIVPGHGSYTSSVAFNVNSITNEELIFRTVEYPEKFKLKKNSNITH